MPKVARYPIIGDQQCCTKCKVYKSFDQFTPLRTTKSGRASWCLSCHRKHAAEARARNPAPKRGHRVTGKVSGRKQLLLFIHCARCDQVLPYVDFSGPTSGYCRRCQAEYALERYHASEEYKQRHIAQAMRRLPKLKQLVAAIRESLEAIEAATVDHSADT